MLWSSPPRALLLLALARLVATFAPPLSGIALSPRQSVVLRSATPETSVVVDVTAEEEDKDDNTAAASAVVDVTAAAAEEATLESTIAGVEFDLERALNRKVEGRGDAYLTKMRCEVPGAAVMWAFDKVREEARSKLTEPGFRPGDVPPWIKRQLTEFALTSVMEDCVKFAMEVHALKILEGDDSEDLVTWNENPAEVSKTFILGSPFTFHAAFNATLSASGEEDIVGGATSIDALYSITPAMVNRAKNILDAKGAVPGLLSGGGGGSYGSSAKKGKKKKKASGGGGKKKRSR